MHGVTQYFQEFTAQKKKSLEHLGKNLSAIFQV